MKLLQILLLACLTTFTYAQMQVVNIGSPTLSAVGGNDAFIDELGNHIVSIYGEDGVYLDYLDSDYQSQWTVRIDSTVGWAEIREISSGEYVMYIRSGPANHGSGLMRFNTNGVLWFKLFPSVTGSVSDFALLDNGHIALITQIGWSKDMGLMVVNSSGAFVWGKQLNNVGHGGGIVNSADGNIVIVTADQISNNTGKVRMLKFDYSGNSIWEKAYDQLTNVEVFNSLIQSSTGEFYAIGRSGDYNQSLTMKVLIRKFSNNGDYLYGKTYDHDFWDDGHDLIEDEDGNFRVISLSKPVANCGGNLMLMKIKPDLDTLDIRGYGDPSGSGTFYKNIRKRQNSYYSLGWGTHWTFPGESQAHLLKIDDNMGLPCKSYKLDYTLSTAPGLTAFTSNTSSTSTQALSTIDGSFALATVASLEYHDACANVQLNVMEHNIDHAVEVFPNPSNGMVLISMVSANQPVQSVELYDLFGNLVLVDESDFFNEHLLDLSTISNGVYLLNLRTDKGVVTKKLVLNK